MVPETGKVAWRYSFETNYECNIATPLEIKGRVLLSAGENHGSVLLELQSRPDGFELKPVWESLGTKSVLRNEWQTSLLWNDRGTLWHFTGGFGVTNVPFRIQTSKDNGATWEAPRLPVLLEPLGGYWPQPISTAFRDAGGAPGLAKPFLLPPADTAA